MARVECSQVHGSIQGMVRNHFREGIVFWFGRVERHRALARRHGPQYWLNLEDALFDAIFLPPPVQAPISWVDVVAAGGVPGAAGEETEMAALIDALSAWEASDVHLGGFDAHGSVYWEAMRKRTYLLTWRPSADVRPMATARIHAYIEMDPFAGLAKEAIY